MKKKELNKTRTTLIDRIDSFEKKCIKNKLNKEETEAAHERLNSVENQLNDYSNLIQFKTQKKNDVLFRPFLTETPKTKKIIIFYNVYNK